MDLVLVSHRSCDIRRSLIFKESSIKRLAHVVLCALFSSTLIAPVSHAASNTALLTICTSLRTGYQLLSQTGKCNEKIYEKSTWYVAGKAPSGTPGSKTVSITVCTSKSRSNLQTLLSKGRSCNRNTQTQSIWQRPLGPPVSPSIRSVAMGLLGTATLNIAAPTEDGGARITSYLVTSSPAAIAATDTPTPTEDGGDRITSYLVISNPEAIAATYTPAQIKAAKIKGLTPGVTYSFAVVAINSRGSSPSSIASAPTLAPNIPNAPSITKVIATGTESAQLSFTAPLGNGGLLITSYVATSSPGNLQRTVHQSAGGKIDITNLSHSTTYTFTLTAINAAGSSSASAISASITTASITTATPSASPAPSVPAPSAPTPSASPSSSAPALAAPAFTLSASSENCTVNTAATGFTISSTGGAIASFAISATPAGMSFSTSTGALSGTPTSVAGATAYTITVTNASGSATATFTLTVSPGAATKAMMTTQPEGAMSGSTFTTQPVVRVTDSSGNTVTTSTAVVTVTKASGSGTLSGTLTATAVAGIATFTNLVITGTGDHVLTFTPDSLTAVNSETLTVGLPAQATLSITSLTTNTKTHPYSQALSITTSGGSGAGATTFAIASGGTATGCTFSNSTATATITATTVGTCLIQATKAADATYSSATSATATFTFQFGAASAAAITTQPAGAVNGSAFTTQPVVRVTDSGGNTITSFTGNVVASIASGSGTLSGTTTVAAVAGVATFTNLVITGTAGNFTLTFTPASLTAVTSSSLAITASAASATAITTQPAGAVSGYAFTTQPVIRIVDASDNTVTSFTGNVVASIASGSGTLSGTTTVAAVAGVATFTNLVITGADAFTLTFTPASLTAVTSSTLTIVAAKVAITRASVGTAHHSAFTTQPQITIQDSSNNTVTSSSAVVTATVSAGGTLVGTTTATASSGVATFTNLGIEGIIGTTYTITYTALGLTVATATVTLTRTTYNGTFVGQVGDIGGGGGIIFYVSSGTFTSTGSTCNTACKYLEAAPTSGTNAWTDAKYAWSGNTSVQIGATVEGTAIGTGYANTLAIVGQADGGDTAGRAGTISRAYRGPNNMSDWFLPSKDELNQMCKWARGQAWTSDITLCNSTGAINSGSGAAGFYYDFYRSSSEDHAMSGSLSQDFFSGQDMANRSKSSTWYVRPVRAFSELTAISVAAIAGVTVPVAGATPVSTTTAGTGYTGAVTWSGSPGTFAVTTAYTATITLTPTSGYTLTGVTANLFTVAGATSATNSANAGVITAAFPATTTVPAAKVAITRASIGTAHGSAFTTQPQITIQYSNGDTFTSSSAVVTATVSAGGTLVGTTTATASSGVGVATFTNLGVDGNIGTTYTITYTAEGLAVATATVTLTSTTCDGNTFTCQVGDTGPGGGKIFYVSSGTFTSTGSTCNSACKYLEAAPTSGTNAWTDAAYAWSGNTTDLIGATAQGTAIGTGYANTLAIVGQASGGGTAGFAGTISQAYRGPNNMSDWFLPSKDELNQMCKWQKGIYGVNLTTLNTVCAGGTSNTGSGAAGFAGSSYYRSSSEFSAAYAWRQDFLDGSQNSHNKSNNYYLVRPVRAF